MGRGDKKSAKGKIAIGSFGKSRLHRPAKKAVPVTAKVEVAEEKPAKK